MSCADVCLDMDCDGWNEFHWARMRRARKVHRCCECDRTIETGERYEYVSGKSEGMVYVEKTCAECTAIRDALVCGGFYYGQLWESIQEEVFPAWQHTGPWDCLAKIESLDARRALQGRYEEWRAERCDP